MEENQRLVMFMGSRHQAVIDFKGFASNQWTIQFIMMFNYLKGVCVYYSIYTMCCDSYTILKA